MEHVLIGDDEILELLNTESTDSPEDFLIMLEDALESGDMSIDEIATMLDDYNKRSL